MLGFMSKLVGGGGGLPYTIGEPYEGWKWGNWQHCKGTKKEDGSDVSIFMLKSNTPSDPSLMAARNGAKRVRTMRHPNILLCHDAPEIEGTPGPTVYIVTEPVRPLSAVLQDLQLEGSERLEYYSWGLAQIAKAVSFLNNDAKLVHGNVCLSTVVVTKTLEWKLMGFDLLTEVAAVGTGDFALQHCGWMVGAQYKPAELAKSDWETISTSPPWAVDSWGLGCLIQEVFAGRGLMRTEDLRNTGNMPQEILPEYQRLLGSAPSRRLNPSKMLEHSVFLKNKLVDTLDFLENLAVKDTVEKETFFRKLHHHTLPKLPQATNEFTILPRIAHALQHGQAPAAALSSVMFIGRGLSEEIFQERIVPVLVMLFASQDRQIRIGLLQNIEEYGAVMPEKVVDEQVYPHLSTGFTDTTAYLRELTLKSMLVLAPKMKQATLNNSLLKHLAKLQVDEEPAIRANTTILLGNLARFLGENSCRRVLLNAFTRGLRDSFPPTRTASIMAMAATIEYYSATEAATRVIPSIAPLTVDPSKDVRDQAFSAIEAFSDLLRENSVFMEKGPEEQAAAAAETAKKKREKEAAAQAAAAAGGGGLMGWAVSSLKSAVGGSGGGQGGDSAANTPTKPGGGDAGGGGGAGAARRRRSRRRRPSARSRWGGAGGGGGGGAAADAAADDFGAMDIGGGGGGGDDDEGDGWGDLDDDFADDEPPAPPPKKASPKPKPKPAPKPAAKASDGWGDEDEDDDDDMWGDMAAPPPPPKPKPKPKPRAPSAKGEKKGPMKLGATKLGATKLAKD